MSFTSLFVDMNKSGFTYVSVHSVHSNHQLYQSEMFTSCSSADGYAFSQEEHGVVSQSQVVRSYDTTRQRPSL